jgi:two-component system nitrate/nitrite response regulator NarL
MSIRITKRQYDTLKCLINGMSNKEIANELGIKKRTVESHMSELLSKFSMSSRLQLVANFDNLVFFVENLRNYAPRAK